jgi:hypothetical protein
MNYKLNQVIECGNGYCVKIDGFGSMLRHSSKKMENTVKYTVYASKSEMAKQPDNQAALYNREEFTDKFENELKGYAKPGTKNINLWLLQQCMSALSDIEADKKSGGKNQAKIMKNAGNIGVGFHGKKFSMSGYKPVMKKEKNRFINLTKPGVFPANA